MYRKANFRFSIVMFLMGLSCVTVTFCPLSVYASVGVFSDVREYDQNDFPGQSRIARMMVYSDATGNAVTVDSTPTGNGTALGWDSGNKLWVRTFNSPPIGADWETTYIFHSGSSTVNLDISGCTIQELSVPNVTISANGSMISWNPVDNANYYSIYWYPLKDGLPDASGGPLLQTGRIYDTSYTLSDPIPGTYALRLNAHEICSSAIVNRSTLYKKHIITIPCTTIATIDVPGKKEGNIDFRFRDCYQFTLPSRMCVTVSLISTDFDTYLSLIESGGKTWNDSDSFSEPGTNSRISTSLRAGTHIIEVSSENNVSGSYKLVISNVLNMEIESICHLRNQMYPAFYPNESWDSEDNPNDWLVEMTEVGGIKEVGRCGKGTSEGVLLECENDHKYTRDCFNHDVCVEEYGYTDGRCWKLFKKTWDDCDDAPDCGGPLFSGPCGGQTPCYTTIQSAIDAARDGSPIRIAAGISLADLTGNTPITITLSGGWDSAFTTDSSKSTVNSLTITDGTIIVNNLVLENRLTITDDGTIIIKDLVIQ